jgi:hypothetical protein
MRKVIVTNPAHVLINIKGKIGKLPGERPLTTKGSFLYGVIIDSMNYHLYRSEFEYLDEYLLKYWLEDEI